MKKIFFLLVLIFLGACEKEDGPPTLTDPTEIGANTVSFIVNGEIWVPKGKNDFSLYNHTLSKTFIFLKDIKNKNSFLQFETQLVNYKNNCFFNFTIDSIDKPGRYKIQRGDLFRDHFPNDRKFHKSFVYNNVEYEIDTQYPDSSYIDITKIKKIIEIGSINDIDPSDTNYILSYPSSFISGRFRIRGKSQYGRIIEITDGRMDLTISTGFTN